MNKAQYKVEHRLRRIKKRLDILEKAMSKCSSPSMGMSIGVLYNLYEYHSKWKPLYFDPDEIAEAIGETRGKYVRDVIAFYNIRLN